MNWPLWLNRARDFCLPKPDHALFVWPPCPSPCDDMLYILHYFYHFCDLDHISSPKLLLPHPRMFFSCHHNLIKDLIPLEFRIDVYCLQATVLMLLANPRVLAGREPRFCTVGTGVVLLWGMVGYSVSNIRWYCELFWNLLVACSTTTDFPLGWGCMTTKMSAGRKGCTVGSWGSTQCWAR